MRTARSFELSPSDHARFWAKVRKTDSCWLWTKNLTPQGYGRFALASSPKWINLPAHRVSYAISVGALDPRLDIDHLCRVRHCVNPAHLEQVTARENILRGISGSAHNARKTHCIRGHEFTPKNTLPAKKGGRHCRTCIREIHRRRAYVKLRARLNA